MNSRCVYIPRFPEPRLVRHSHSSPTRTTSIYDLQGETRTTADRRKPQLLNSVVFQEELKDIVSRLTRPTLASRMRATNFRPETQYTHVDMGSYKWNRMNIFTDYQKHIYSANGSVRPGFKRTVRANYRAYY